MTDEIKEAFDQFDAEHPMVYALFSRFAWDMADKCKNGSASMIFERMRWEAMLYGLVSVPKLNNNFRALYARKWEEDNPTKRGFFHKRKRRSVTSNSTSFDAPD